jgi:hypothetical protein
MEDLLDRLPRHLEEPRGAAATAVRLGERLFEHHVANFAQHRLERRLADVCRDPRLDVGRIAEHLMRLVDELFLEERLRQEAAHAELSEAERLLGGSASADREDRRRRAVMRRLLDELHRALALEPEIDHHELGRMREHRATLGHRVRFPHLGSAAARDARERGAEGAVVFDDQDALQ